MRFGASLLAGCAALLATAQLEVPVRIVLNAPEVQDRQITGLAAPQSADAGVSADAVRENAVSFCTVNGTLVLAGSLVPAPSGYTTGMLVTIYPTEANASGAQLDLNGTGPAPIVKAGGLPVDSADLAPGVPHRLVYDGVQFRLLSSSYLPCPQGFHVAGREYCIEDSVRTPLSFPDAMEACVGIGARLCTFAEWIHACQADPGFIGTVLDYEWVDHAANNQSNAKRVGRGSDGNLPDDQGINCRHGHHSLWSNLTGFRCCKTR
jgi:hypothetical protein